MIALDGTDHVYTPKWLKAKEKETYQEHVYFLELNGKSNGFKNIANYLLYDAWYKNKKDRDKEEHIIQTIAKIITWSTNYQCENHPSAEEITNIEKISEWLTNYLHLLMKCIVKSKTRCQN